MRVDPARWQRGQVLLPMLFVLLVTLATSWLYALAGEARRAAVLHDARLLGMLRQRLLDVVRGGSTLEKRTWSGWLRRPYVGGNCLVSGARQDCSHNLYKPPYPFGLGLYPLADLAPSARPGSGRTVWYAAVSMLVRTPGDIVLTAQAVKEAPALQLPDHGIDDAMVVLVIDQQPVGIHERNLNAHDIPDWASRAGGLEIGRKLAPPSGRWAVIRRHEYLAALTPMADAAAAALVACRNWAAQQVDKPRGCVDGQGYDAWLDAVARDRSDPWLAALPASCRTDQELGNNKPGRGCLWPLAWRDTLQEVVGQDGFRFKGCRRRYTLQAEDGTVARWSGPAAGNDQLGHDGTPC
ncbi:hypothetical protein DFO50_10167 [Microvirgula sp. AG722]|uniref:hypothetical protein n=1 Tax=Microvirgula sp. AG722 TaxID=2183901 RepID=UPI000DC3EA50|nr:hypothetical protein [Microvirgula sp. AG722]RAS19687.1 hypothetical protein DFO50_10167 [Microvirgula sp. AG722]